MLSAVSIRSKSSLALAKAVHKRRPLPQASGASCFTEKEAARLGVNNLDFAPRAAITACVCDESFFYFI
jgi:hypothetical protein